MVLPPFSSDYVCMTVSWRLALLSHFIKYNETFFKNKIRGEINCDLILSACHPAFWPAMIFIVNTKMNSENKSIAFISDNWHIISGAFVLTFAIGGLYSKIENQHTELEYLKEKYEKHLIDAENDHIKIQEKQDAKWGDIPEIEQRVDDLEEWKAFYEGTQHNK